MDHNLSDNLSDVSSDNLSDVTDTQINNQSSTITNQSRVAELAQVQTELTRVENELNRVRENLALKEKELEKLQQEFSENTIIQSMNDMKIRYENLIDTTVSLAKYNRLLDKYNNLYRIIYSSDIFLDHACAIAAHLENVVYDSTHKNLTTLVTELKILKDIFTDTLAANRILAVNSRII